MWNKRPPSVSCVVIFVWEGANQGNLWWKLAIFVCGVCIIKYRRKMKYVHLQSLDFFVFFRFQFICFPSFEIPIKSWFRNNFTFCHWHTHTKHDTSTVDVVHSEPRKTWETRGPTSKRLCACTHACARPLDAGGWTSAPDAAWGSREAPVEAFQLEPQEGSRDRIANECCVLIVEATLPVPLERSSGRLLEQIEDSARASDCGPCATEQGENNRSDSACGLDNATDQGKHRRALREQTGVFPVPHTMKEIEEEFQLVPWNTAANGSCNRRAHDPCHRSCRTSCTQRAPRASYHAQEEKDHNRRQRTRDTKTRATKWVK